MRRPSHWILLSMALGALGYGAFQLAVESGSRGRRTQVVVRGAQGDRDPLPIATVSGRVIGPKGWPVNGAHVRLLEGDEAIETDASGVFALAGDGEASRYLLHVSAPGLEARIVAAHADEVTSVALRKHVPWESRAPVQTEPSAPLLRGEGFLVGRDGSPLANAVVACLENGARRTTDDNGQFRIALPRDRATLIAWDTEGQAVRQEIEVPDGEHGLMPLAPMELSLASSVRGYVKTAHGDPAPGASLLLRAEDGLERRVVADDAGSFAFVGLIAGDYDLAVLPHRGEPGTQQRIEVAGITTDVELTLAADEPFAVQVRDQQGPVEGAWVLAEAGAGSRRAVATTDDLGRAVLTGLGDGPFEFEVREPERYESCEILAFDPESAELTVALP